MEKITPSLDEWPLDGWFSFQFLSKILIVEAAIPFISVLNHLIRTVVVVIVAGYTTTCVTSDYHH
jgi:hypothetical protein